MVPKHIKHAPPKKISNGAKDECDPNGPKRQLPKGPRKGVA